MREFNNKSLLFKFEYLYMGEKKTDVKEKVLEDLDF